MTEPYDPEISKLCAVCTKLAYEQYDKGLQDPNYDGAITELPSYSLLPKGYTQVLALKDKEIDPLNFSEVKPKIDNLISQKFKSQGLLFKAISRELVHIVEHTLSTDIESSSPIEASTVYFGFLLKSQDKNILAFRGTETPTDWLYNLIAFQANISDYIANKVDYNTVKVHLGFILQYTYFSEAINTALKQIETKVPLYVTGHSLGAAISTLASFVIETYNKEKELATEIINYSYASPRVGNNDFQEKFDALIPQAYRILNFGDLVPMLPPSKLMEFQYKHVGIAYDYLYYKGDVAINHNFLLNYLPAVNENVPMNKPLLPDHPISCRN